MNYQYILANPTGNITVLVTTDVPEAERLSVVQEVFSKEPSCEQVGFVEVTGDRRIRLEMMGGEFCGNATLSAAAYCAQANRLYDAAMNQIGDEVTITVDASGTEQPVPVALRCLDVEKGEYEGTLEMPMPQLEGAGDAGNCQGEYAVVHLDGISHMIVPTDTMTHEEAESAIKEYANQYDALAFGMLLYSETDQGVSIEPLVYVKGSDTLVWEHGCASGSIAAAYYCYSKMQEKTVAENGDGAVKNGKVSVDVHQPGGIITIDIAGDKLYLTGKIKL